MAKRTPSFEEVVLGGGIVDLQVCEVKRVHQVDATASVALVLGCGHTPFVCRPCYRDMMLCGVGRSPDGGRGPMRCWAEGCMEESHIWEAKQL